MTFRLATVDGRPALVDHDGGWHSIDRIGGVLSGLATNALLEHLDQLHALAAMLDHSSADGVFAAALADGRVGAPVPEPRAVFGIGLNYGSHAAETGKAVPELPLVFTKFPTCIVGPRADIVLDGESTDYEVELVVVVGRGGRHIAKADAWSHVAGLTIGQDVSDRALQYAVQPPQFSLGKSRDTYGPMGPMLVSVDAFADRDDLALTCAINGDVRQSDHTANLIFDVPTLVSYLSGIVTLRAGDVIFSGTPEGVGVATGRFLRAGDVVTSTIDGIGTMENRCV